MITILFIFAQFLFILSIIRLVNKYHTVFIKEHYTSMNNFANEILSIDESNFTNCTPSETRNRSKNDENVQKANINIKKVLTSLNELESAMEQIESNSNNVCDQVEYTEFYRYNDREYDRSEDVRQDIREQTCFDRYDSCGRVIQYEQISRFENIGQPECDYLNDETQIQSLSYTCPNTQNCNAGCNGITHNNTCYQLFDARELRNRVWRIRHNRGEFLDISQSDFLQLRGNQAKKFKIIVDGGKVMICESNDHSKRWGIIIHNDLPKLVSTNNTQEYIQLNLYKSSSNNKYLIQIQDHGWLSTYNSIGIGYSSTIRLEISERPTLDWEILRA